MRNYQTMSSSANIKLFIFAAIVTACVVIAPAQVPSRPAAPPARLLADLKNPSAATRREAANQLGAMRADASRALIEALSDKDAGVREAAAFALGQIASRAATERLTRLLADKDAEVRATAAFALGMLGDRRSIAVLSKAQDDADAGVRSSAVVGLGLMQDEDAVDELIEMLTDSSFDVRYDAAWSLGQIGEPDADSPLRMAVANLDLPGVNDASREAFRQAVQNALDRLRTEEHAQSAPPPRPRRATGVIAEPQRYSSTTRPARIRQSVKALATERASRARITGTVVLQVLVAADGSAVRAYVVRRLGYGLDQRAVQAILQYKFETAMQSGLPQSTWIEVEVKF
jgi:TonB family protein